MIYLENAATSDPEPAMASRELGKESTENLLLELSNNAFHQLTDALSTACLSF